MMFMSVDLPEPDGPTMATNSPALDCQVEAVEGADIDATGVVDAVDVLERTMTGSLMAGSPARWPPPPTPEATASAREPRVRRVGRLVARGDGADDDRSRRPSGRS